MNNKERLRGKENEPKRHLWIQIMGVPASGKTILGEYISKELGLSFVGEASVEENPFFERYYKDPKRWSLAVQMYFLFDKRCQVIGIDSTGEIGIRKLLESRSVVSEPPVYQDGLYAQARLEQYPKQMEIYQDFFDGMVNDGQQNPDLLLYLRLSFPTFLSRLQERARKDPVRKVELKESEKYWKRLWELHEQWIEENPFDLSIIIINGDEFDFSKYVNPDEAKKKLLAEFIRLAKRSLVDNKNIILPGAPT